MDVRSIAYNLIRDWDEQSGYPNLALKNILRTVLEERDRRFISAIVYGVIEKKITLDHFISQCTDRPIEKISAPVQNALRMGIYQMFYMNVPESAACNTTVEIIKKSGFSHSCGFVNAILRRCAREKDELLLLKKADYSVRFSIDPAIVDLLLQQYGKETFLNIVDGISANDNAVHLFHNTKRGTEAQFISIMKEEDIGLTPTEIPHLFKTLRGFSVEDSVAYNSGWYHIVGLNSARAASLVPSNAANILDLCAAPGGKTFIMAAKTMGLVHAYDIYPHKVALMQKSAERLRHHNIQFSCADATIYNSSLSNTADFILCDVPCSGLGIMGKKPDIKYKAYDSEELTKIQYNILKNASDYLKIGGLLVYSTCTLDHRENEEQIACFLKENSNFELDVTSLEDGQQTFLPQNNEDGFFIAALRKVSF